MAAAVALTSFPPEAAAVAWEVRPIFSVRAGVDDNVDLVLDPPEDTVYSADATLGLTLRRVTETVEVLAAASLGYETYTDGGNEPDDEDLQRLQLESARRTSERAVWRLDGDYRRDSTTADVEAVQEEIDPGADIDAGLVEESIRRERLIASPSFEYEFTERFSGIFDYRVDILEYDDEPGVDLVDSVTHTAQVVGSYALSEIHTMHLGIRGIAFRSDDDTDDVDSYGLFVGSDRELTERSSLGIEAGVQNTEPQGDNEDDSGTGFVGRLYGQTRGETWTVDGALERSLRPSGEGELRETDQVIARLSRDLSPRWNVALVARAFETRETDGAGEEDQRQYFTASPRLSWRLTPTWTVGASYRYRWNDDDDAPDTAESNAFFISLEYRPPSEVPGI